MLLYRYFLVPGSLLHVTPHCHPIKAKPFVQSFKKHMRTAQGLILEVSGILLFDGAYICIVGSNRCTSSDPVGETSQDRD